MAVELEEFEHPESVENGPVGANSDESVSVSGRERRESTVIVRKGLLDESYSQYRSPFCKLS
jgi:hypothetical protein